MLWFDMRAMESEATVALVDLFAAGYLCGTLSGQESLPVVFVFLPFSYLSDFCRYYQNSLFLSHLCKLLNLTL